MDRRQLMGLGALALGGAALAGTRAAAAPLTLPTAPEIIPLWPNGPPGGETVSLVLNTVETSTIPDIHNRQVSGIAHPTLTVFRPQTPDGSALLIIPGGSYFFEAEDNEGFGPASLFAARGITAFVLTYRLPAEGWKNGANVPLQDAQRAMRIIRYHCPDYGHEPTRSGVLGFSAGGHLAALLTTKYETDSYPATDAIDKYDAKPSFAALLYPVITMLLPYAHEASRVRLLGTKVTTAQRAAYSAERFVTVATPPTFLCAADDDTEVPLDNTFMMFGSLRAAKVPSEMHIFEKGGHGFGLGPPTLPVSQWPELFLRWGASHSYFRNVAV
jgi:acetyl esterase/lipase